jgi:hypothetical protein
MEELFEVVEDYTPKIINKQIKTGFDAILEQGKRNAKCEINPSSVKMEGKPIVLTDGVYDNSSSKKDIVFKTSKEISDDILQVHKIVKSIDENNMELREKEIAERNQEANYHNRGDTNKIEYPITKLKRENYRYGKMIKVITYVTICQMYNGILIEEKLSIRKGRGYEYKHQREIYQDEFFNLILDNKKEVYDNLGYENSILVEELLTRLYDIGMFKDEEYDDITYNYNSTTEEREKVVTKKIRHTLSSRNDDNYNEKIEEELENLNGLKVMFKEPIVVLNTQRYEDSYEQLEIHGFTIDDEEKGIKFMGVKIEENTSRTHITTFDLSYQIYNYLYKHYEKVIQDVLSKAVFELRKNNLKREMSFKQVENKCQRYLLPAKLIGVDINKVFMKDY